jgi:hypothetical protein
MINLRKPDRHGKWLKRNRPMSERFHHQSSLFYRELRLRGYSHADAKKLAQQAAQ